MSYCRWSCDDFRCDLYVYESIDGGYRSHAASMRYAGECPRLPKLSDIHGQQDVEPRRLAIEAWVEASRRQRWWLEQAVLVPIGLPHDGESFHDGTLTGLLVRLVELARIGYRIPSYVFQRIRDEIAYQAEVAKVAA